MITELVIIYDKILNLLIMIELFLYIEPQELMADYEIGKAVRWLFYIGCIYFFIKILNSSKKERNQIKPNKSNNNLSSKSIIENDFDFTPKLTLEEIEKANRESIGIPSLDEVIWDRLETALKYKWCVEAQVLSVDTKYLKLILLIPDDLALPFKEKMKSYKKGILPITAYSEKKSFDEIDEANLLGNNINVQISSIDRNKEEIILKPYKRN